MADRNIYALLSARVYNSSRTNEIFIPTDWTELPEFVDNSFNGLYARAYRNNTTGEIVIAFRGTNTTISDGTLQDWVTNLSAGLGIPDGQVAQAMSFYASIKATYGVNGGSNISFTGHSLGGALANLMGAQTGESVVGFNSLGVKELLPTLGYDANATYANIRNISAAYDPARLVGTRIGSVRNVFVSSYAFVFDVVEPLFAGVLATQAGLLPLYHFAYSQHLIKNMVETLAALPEGSEGIPPASIPLSFDENYQLSGPAVDEWNSLKAALNGDSSLEQNLTNPTYDDEGQLANAAILAEQTVDLDTFRGYDAADVPAFIAGGNGFDLLSGGSGTDFIFGDDGDDILNGEGGNDILLGGTGTDTYYYRAGDGHDTLIDSDNLGRIVYVDATGNSHVLHGGIRPQGNGGAYTDETGRFVYTQNGDTLSIALDGVAALTVQNFTGNSLHLALRERIQPVAQVDTIQGTAYGDGTENIDLNGDGTNDLQALTGTAESELLLGLAGNDIVNGNAGDDRLLGDAGQDRLDGGTHAPIENDVIMMSDNDATWRMAA